jgi:glycosyltransferase involved in cell wall biosynthesis
LVIAGRPERGGPFVPEAARRDIDAGNIRLLGVVPRFLLRILYRGTRLALFPSRTSGFGLALAEALVCGAPVAVGRDTALAEIAGPFAIQVDPLDVTEWREAMADQIDRGAHLMTNAQPVGFSWAFSWDRAAEQAMAVYHQALSAEYQLA